MRSGLRYRGTVGALSLVLGLSLPLLPPSATATSQEVDAWLKPGVPLSGQQHPDPSAVPFGRLVVSSATQHGGADLPVVWSQDLQRWFAREPLKGSEHLDGDKKGFFNDAIDAPPWGSYESCQETKANRSQCDPKDLWAPGFAFVGDHWVSYSAVKVSNSRKYSSYGRFAIYRATADTPFGMYKSVSRKPLVVSDKKKDPAGVLDPEVFVDQSSPTKQAYLLYKTEGNRQGNPPTLWSRKLDAEGTSFAKSSKAVKLLARTKDRPWEGRIVENPSMIKLNGVYLLFYSANDYPTRRYTTAYAICRNGPSAPCTKPKDGRLLTSRKGSYGPGGADALVDDRGRNLLMYHAYPRLKGTRGIGGRQPRVAEFTVAPGGKVTIVHRTVTAGGGPGGQTWYGGPGATFTAVKEDVSGDFTPFVADMNHDGIDDIALYRPWAGGNRWILGNAGRAPTPDRAASDRDNFGREEGQGSFEPVTGDFDADGKTDVVWYEPGNTSPFLISTNRLAEPSARPDNVWATSGRHHDEAWRVRGASQNNVAIPIVGNFDGQPGGEILWYGPGSGPDQQWTWNGGQKPFTKSDRTIPGIGTAQPAVGDLDGSGKDDILWYEPGSPTATIWWNGGPDGATTLPVGATTQDQGRRPVIGDFDGDSKAEVLWYGPRTTPDVLWSGFAPGAGMPTVIAPSNLQLEGNDVYQPLVGDFDHDGTDDIYWYG